MTVTVKAFDNGAYNRVAPPTTALFNAFVAEVSWKSHEGLDYCNNALNGVSVCWSEGMQYFENMGRIDNIKKTTKVTMSSRVQNIIVNKCSS